jgi:hypothetical protein
LPKQFALLLAGGMKAFVFAGVNQLGLGVMVTT